MNTTATTIFVVEGR